VGNFTSTLNGQQKLFVRLSHGENHYYYK